jgi:hypothetical protein
VKLSRSTRRAALGIAVFAILLNTFAPAISRTLATWRGQPSMWAEIQAHAAAADEAATNDYTHNNKAHDHASSGNHCPFCVTHAGSFGLTPSVPSVFLAFGRYDIPPLASYRSPAHLFFRATAQPRAPPLVS